MSNLLFLLPKNVDGCPNFTHVYIYTNKPVFSRQTDQTDCTVNSGIINVAIYDYQHQDKTEILFVSLAAK